MRQLVKIVVLLAAIGILAVVNIYMMREPLPLTPTFAANRSASQLPGTDSDSGEYKAAFGDLSFVQSFSRPLFNEDRRKFQPPQAKAKPNAKKPTQKRNAASVEPPQIKLVGLSLTPTSSRALILVSNTNDTSWITVGEKVQGWEVVAIDDNSLVVENNGDRISIDLHPAKDGS